DGLRDRVRGMATVRRNGHGQVVPAVGLVPGDVVRLEPGERVSAELRVTGSSGLRVDESLLTGESVPRPAGEGAALYAGTHVTDGLAEAVVTTTGARTRLGGLTRLTRATHRPPSPLSRQLHRVVTVIAATAVAVGVACFGVAVAVGLGVADELLLALGAIGSGSCR